MSTQVIWGSWKEIIIIFGVIAIISGAIIIFNIKNI